MTTNEHVARALLRARRFDEIAVGLQRQGAIDSYAPAFGQELEQIAATVELRPDDMVFPTYRQPAVALLRGISPVELLRFYAGTNFTPWDWRARGFFAYCIPVGSQTSHAVGYAWAIKLRAEKAVTIAFFGDGASSQGEVHEAMNLAGVLKVPVVFLCENNGWAISMPFAGQTAAEGLYLRAAGYGFPGERVDGSDFAAVRTAMGRAVERARGGAGPSLVEINTYRMGAHTTSDDPSRYRPNDDMAERTAADPMRRFLDESVDEGKLSGSVLNRIEIDVQREFEEVVRQFIAERQREPDELR
jgi:2-oxoisovalerate dehydrogenase E1 component alpha subunit